MDNLPRFKTPLDHQREVVAIAQQQLALACAQSLCEPDNQKWSAVISRLSDWVHRLQSDERHFSARRSARLPEANEHQFLPN